MRSYAAGGSAATNIQCFIYARDVADRHRHTDAIANHGRLPWPRYWYCYAIERTQTAAAIRVTRSTWRICSSPSAKSLNNWTYRNGGRERDGSRTRPGRGTSGERVSRLQHLTFLLPSPTASFASRPGKRRPGNGDRDFWLPSIQRVRALPSNTDISRCGHGCRLQEASGRPSG